MRIESDTENAKEPTVEQQQKQQQAQQRSSRSPQQQNPQQQQGSKSRSGSQTVSSCNLMICANSFS